MQTIHEHLLSRHCNLSLHNPAIDEQDRVATFYLYNLSGQIVGYQHYRPDASKERHNHPKEGRYFTLRKQPTVAVFGVESLHLTPNLLFVTEGIFDACRLTEKGVSAIAVLSNDPSQDVANWLSMLPKTTVAVCDNDKAGRRLAKFCQYAEYTNDHDLGDSSEEFVNTLIAKYNFSHTA